MRSIHKMTFAAIAILMIAGQAAASDFTAMSSRQLLADALAPAVCNGLDNTWTAGPSPAAGNVNMCNLVVTAPRAAIVFGVGSPAFPQPSCQINSVVSNEVKTTANANGYEDFNIIAATPGDDEHLPTCKQVTRRWTAVTPFTAPSLPIVAHGTLDATYTLHPTGVPTMTSVRGRLHRPWTCSGRSSFPDATLVTDVAMLQPNGQNPTASDSCNNLLHVRATPFQTYTKVPNACAAQATVKYTAYDCNAADVQDSAHKVEKSTTIVITPDPNEVAVGIEGATDLYCIPKNCPVAAATTSFTFTSSTGSPDNELDCFINPGSSAAHMDVSKWITSVHGSIPCQETFNVNPTLKRELLLPGQQPTVITEDVANFPSTIASYTDTKVKVATMSYTVSTDCASHCSTANLWLLPCVISDNDASNLVSRRMMM